MGLNFLQTVFFGFLSGLTNILPVSSQVHKLVFLKIFGSSEPALIQLSEHLAILAALYFCCFHQIRRLLRARKLAKMSAKRRRRPLDKHSLIEISLLSIMLIPIILGFAFYGKLSALAGKLVWASLFLFINGVIMYIPQFLPGSNKDAKSLSRLDGLLIGFGGALSVFPGVSCIGAGMSIASVRGAEKNYGLSIVLLMSIPVMIGFVAFDIIALFAGNLIISIKLLIDFFIIFISAFAGAYIGIRAIRVIVANSGLYVFSFYCWGMSLLAFILYLTAA